MLMRIVCGESGFLSQGVLPSLGRPEPDLDITILQKACCIIQAFHS